MLGFMRKFVKSKWSIGLFALLIISFGVFGFSDPFSGVTGGGFIQVGDREVRPADVNKQVDVVLEQYRREKGEILSARDAAKQGVTREVMLREVNRIRIAEFGRKIGAVASEASVTSMISTADGFKDSLGRLSMDAIRSEAQFRKITVAEYVQFLRDVRTADYIERSVDAALVTPDILTRPLLSFNGETRTLSVARVAPEAIPQPKTPPDEELRAFYGKNSVRFQQPERRRISMLSYSPADYTDKVELKQDEIRAEYERRIKQYSSPETRQVAQYTSDNRNALQTFIDLVKGGKSADEALKQAPGVTPMDLMLKPGDLTEKQYDALVFSMPIGQLQGPFAIQEQFYAVEVKSITPGVPTPFEQVADAVRNDLAQSAAVRLFENSEEGFYDMAGGISLEEIAKNIGAPVIQLDAIDANATTKDRLQSSLLAKYPEAVRTLFSVSAGQTTDVIEGDNERALFRVDEILPAHTLAYEEVAVDVRGLYLQEQMHEAADKMANDMVASLKGGMAFDKAATTHKLAALAGIEIMRAANSQIDPNVLALAFSLPQGEAGVAHDQQGNPWVVKIDKIAPIKPELEATLKSQIDRSVAETLTADIREVFARGVDKIVAVKPNQKAVDAFFENLTKDEAQ